MSGEAKDRWGVPIGMFGEVDEDFVAVLGRVTMVSALVESDAEMLASALGSKRQDEWAGAGFTEAAKGIARLVVGDQAPAARPDLPERVQAELQVLALQLTDLSRRRNDVVHGVWFSPRLAGGGSWKHLRSGVRHPESKWTGAATDADQLPALLTDLVRAHADIKRLSAAIEAVPRRVDEDASPTDVGHLLREQHPD